AKAGAVAPVAPAAAGWVGLGPAPLASDATGTGFQDYNWVSGRATSVLIDPADNTGNTVLLGGAYGGLWRSTNAGSKSSDPSLVNWQALIDDQPTLAVGALALQPGNSNVMLVGTGETNSSDDSYYGLGILRSADGGSTWTQITSAASGQSFLGVGFSKIAFSTANPNLVVAATAGDLGFLLGLEDGTQAGRGLYYSTNAGATWNRVILSDGAVPASTPAVVYNRNQGASGTFYAFIRRHGLYSSTDGQHFTRLTTQPIAGLASGLCPPGSNSMNCQIYRGEFGILPSRNEMYVWIVDVQPDVHGNLAEVDRGIWRTTAGGSSWTQIPNTGITNCGDSDGCGVQQGVYNLELAAVPNSTATDLYAGTINIYKCTLASGATSCTQGNWLNLTHVYGCNPLGSLAHVHPDQHGLDFLVAGGKAAGYFAHDGGISRTLDGFTGLATGSCTGTNQFDSLSQTLGSMTEFVSFSVHPSEADILLGGTQDNGSPKTQTATSSTTWQNALGGDGGFNAINPNNGNEWFASNPDASAAGFVISECAVGTACDDNHFSLIVDSSKLGGDHGAFYTPYILDPQNTGEMLVGTCRVWRISTSGTAPLQLSNNFDTLGTGVCTGSEVNLVTALDAGGPKDVSNNSKVVYATTDGTGPLAKDQNGVHRGGEVWVTPNAGAALMTNVTQSINPNHYAVSFVAMDKSDPTGQTAFVGIQGFSTVDFPTSLVWKTTNAGASWTDWTGTGLPDAPVDALLVDSQDGLIYAGTDVGVFVSSTSVPSWTEVGPAPGPGATGFLPNAPATAVRMFNSGGTKKLRVSTYGRGIWEFALAVAPDYRIAISNSPQTVFPAQNATFNGTLTALNGYNSPVNLSCTGTPPATCTPDQAQVTPLAPPGAPFTVTAGGAVGDYTFNAHGVGTDANAIQHDAAMTLHVVDFALDAPSPNALTVQQGGTATSTFHVSALGAFNGTVTLSCTGLPANATCGFAPSANVNPVLGNPVTVTMTVGAAANTPVGGPATVTLQASTPGAPAAKTQTFTLTVTAPPNFTWSGGGSHTVLAGQTTLAYNFTATPAGGPFSSTVTFGCSNLPDATVTCVFSPTQIAAGAGATPVSLTITTKGPNPGTGNAVQRAGKRSPWLPLTLPIAGIVMVGLVGRRVSKHSAIAGLLVAMAFLGVFVACGGVAGNGPPPPPSISVTVSPSTTVNLYANEAGNAWPVNLTQQQFTAVVNNSTNQTVTWAVTGGAGNGTIDTNTGLYTAPATSPGATVTVTATAQADATKSGTGRLSILTPTVLGTFPNISVSATEGEVTHSQTVSLTVQ
ncbi:MAG: hypothetical protein WAQ52_04855, partial [Terriglobales bacterium]